MPKLTKHDKKNIRFLVLDDEEPILEILSSLMNRFHYKGDFFSNPAAALKAVHENQGRYQLVLADIRMPDMNGLEFANELRKVNPEVPIIFMTGYVDDEIKDKVLSMEKVVFLEKPFHLEKTFKEVIPKLLALDK